MGKKNHREKSASKEEYLMVYFTCQFDLQGKILVKATRKDAAKAALKRLDELDYQNLRSAQFIPRERTRLVESSPSVAKKRAVQYHRKLLPNNRSLLTSAFLKSATKRRLFSTRTLVE